jgi:carboxysome shell carbonic anhydrase
MNTRNAYALRARAAQETRAAAAVPARLLTGSAALDTSNAKRSGFATGSHPLTDGAANARLAYCEESVKGRFDAIVPALQAIAGLPRGVDFPDRAQALAQERLGYALDPSVLESAWVAGPDLKALFAHCTFAALRAAIAQFTRDLQDQRETARDASNFFLDCGFHAVDLSPCADGRLKGLLRYILRLPLSSFTWHKAYAGALFDIETDVRHWMAAELRRYREGVPSTADANTRYLKVAVYHISGSAPCQEGCAAHGSNDRQAIEAALERLNQFRQAIENSFCCGASTDLLLIGVDTDTDAIRVHTPDARGELNAYRYVDNAQVFRDTHGQSADQARLAVHEAIRTAAATKGWGAGQGEPHEGMRRLIANLLINNLSQIDYVLELYDGRYSDLGHAERYISVGDGFEEVQLRNISYYSHLHTVEEGAAHLDVGIKIFKGLNLERGLPIPVAVHYRYDSKVPGARERTIEKARRVAAAIAARYPDLHAQGLLVCQLSVQDRPAGSPLELVDGGTQ